MTSFIYSGSGQTRIIRIINFVLHRYSLAFLWVVKELYFSVYFQTDPAFRQSSTLDAKHFTPMCSFTL